MKIRLQAKIATAISARERSRHCFGPAAFIRAELIGCGLGRQYYIQQTCRIRAEQLTLLIDYLNYNMRLQARPMFSEPALLLSNFSGQSKSSHKSTCDHQLLDHHGMKCPDSNQQYFEVTQEIGNVLEGAD